MSHTIPSTLWTKTKQLAKFSGLTAAILLALSPATFAAKVPAGAVLADKQVINIQTTAEAATLDPQKWKAPVKVCSVVSFLKG